MILTFLKTLWETKNKRDEYSHQVWMIIVGLILLALMSIAVLENLGWLVAGFIGAAGWTYRDKLLAMLPKFNIELRKKEDA